MLSSVPISLLVGTVLGFLSGLGIGGGSLLILWLTVVLKIEPEIARSINLIFFIPSALVACVFRIKKNELKIKPLLPAIFTGCIAAFMCSLLAKDLNTAVLKKGFAFLLLAAGFRELFYRERKAK